MKRALIALIVCMAMLTTGTAFAGDYEYELNMGTLATKDTPWGKQLKKYKKGVEKASEGRIKVKIHWGGKMGDEVSMVRQTKRNDLQAFAGSTGALATQVPEAAIFELCGLFKNLKEADKVIDNALTAPMKELLEANGFVHFANGENGFRNFATKGKKIETVADLKGLKMRAQESWVHEEMYRANGGNPVQMPVSEVSSSLATGNIDGFDNTPLFAFAAQWYKNIDTWIISDHIYQPAMIVYNKEWYDGLPDDLKTVVMADAEAQKKLGRKLVRKMMPKLVENMKAADITVIEMSAEAKKELADNCKKVVHKKYVDDVGPEGAKLLKAAYKEKGWSWPKGW